MTVFLKPRDMEREITNHRSETSAVIFFHIFLDFLSYSGFPFIYFYHRTTFACLATSGM